MRIGHGASLRFSLSGQRYGRVHQRADQRADNKKTANRQTNANAQKNGSSKPQYERRKPSQRQNAKVRFHGEDTRFTAHKHRCAQKSERCATLSARERAYTSMLNYDAHETTHLPFFRKI